MAIGLCVVAMPTTLRAQGGSPDAAASEPRSFDIPAQPLTEALIQFGRQAGLQASTDPRLVEDLRSMPVAGIMTWQQALSTLLTGTGLTYRLTGSLVTLERAVAQPESGPMMLDQIMVQGEIRDRPLADSPTSAVIVTGEELERTGGDEDIYDLVDRTPGITSTGDNEGFTIRGINNRGTNAAGGQTINVQVDGVSLPDFASVGYGPYSTWDLGQVEILRGPQSTQQGRNALAGAVIIRSADPVFVPEYRVRGEVGSDGLLRGSIALNQPFGETIAVRLSADVLESDGFIDNVTRDEPSDPSESRTYRAKLRWFPTDSFDAILSYTRAETFGGGDGDFADGTLFPDDFVNFSNRESREGADHDIFGLRWRYNLSDALTLNSETSYLRRRGLRLLDFDGTAVDAPFAQTNSAFFRDAEFNVDVFEQDVFLDFAFGRFDGTVGVFYTQINDRRPGSDVFDFTGTAPPIPGLSFIQAARNDLDQDTENIAVYGEVEIGADEIFPGLSFTVGGRYEREEIETSSSTVFDPGGFPPELIAAFPQLAGSSFSGSDSFTAFLPKIGVNYDFDGGDQRVSLTYQRGYRAGGVRATSAGEINEFDAEFSDTIELAYRGAFLDDRLALRANAFYSRIRDQQVNIVGAFGVPGDFIVENAGRSEVYGAEFAIEAEVTDRLTIAGDLALVETNFIEFVSSGVDLSGNRFPGTRPITAALSATYAFDDNWSIDVRGIYNDSSFADAENAGEFESDDWFVANAQLTYRHEVGITAGAYVNNIFDNRYVVSRDIGAGSTGLIDPVVPGAPRQVGLFVQYDF